MVTWSPEVGMANTKNAGFCAFCPYFLINSHQIWYKDSSWRDAGSIKIVHTCGHVITGSGCGKCQKYRFLYILTFYNLSELTLLLTSYLYLFRGLFSGFSQAIFYWTSVSPGAMFVPNLVRINQEIRAGDVFLVILLQILSTFLVKNTLKNQPFRALRVGAPSRNSVIYILIPHDNQKCQIGASCTAEKKIAPMPT